MKPYALRLAPVLAVVLLALSACGQETATTPSTQPPSQTETSVVSPLPTPTTGSAVEPEPDSSPEPTATVGLISRDHTPKSDLGIVEGLLSLNGQPAPEFVLYLAPIIATREEMEIASLDAVTDPRAQTDGSGYFAFVDVPPGRYALGIASPAGPVLIRIDGLEIIAEVEAGEITDLSIVPIKPFVE